MVGGLLRASAEPASGPTLEEIVVTAQKPPAPCRILRSRCRQLAGTDPQFRGGNITDFARNVAGLTIADLGPGQSQVAIRGISSGQVIRDQPASRNRLVSTWTNRHLGRPVHADLELFDLDRIEVLRGPQGTLFGAGVRSGHGPLYHHPT